MLIYPFGFILIHTKLEFLRAGRVWTYETLKWLLDGITASAVQRFFQECSDFFRFEGLWVFFFFLFPAFTLIDFNPS